MDRQLGVLAPDSTGPWSSLYGSRGWSLLALGPDLWASNRQDLGLALYWTQGLNWLDLGDARDQRSAAVHIQERRKKERNYL